MTNEIDGIFAALSSEPPRKRKRSTADTVKQDSKQPAAKRTDPPSARARSQPNADATKLSKDAPGRPVPVVVHDTSSKTSTAPKQSRARPDDEDAAFADSRGRDRKRTEEGFRIFTEEELRLNEGGGTPLCPFDCNCCF
ncbi:hypothetical protein MNAN1_000420 [Malassezia nana]|uniref:DUF1764-domain-containing protein n=1 Tax=Malassezia nana TaxID=180528 RepID=A0AAF0EIY7_9BASI|nr:hypothetical protein MNAN1_000420 [Malassezia nana]